MTTSRPRHVPMRRCVACRQSRPQAELVRLCRDAAGDWQLDPERRAPGRGAWLCRDKPACQESKALKRFFRAQAGSVAEELARWRAEPESKQPERRSDRNTQRNGGMNAR
ncbi:MAG TPA: YlxR family protein [Trueperaceae bacterium]